MYKRTSEIQYCLRQRNRYGCSPQQQYPPGACSVAADQLLAAQRHPRPWRSITLHYQRAYIVLFTAQSASVILNDEGTQEVELTTTYGPPPAFHTLRYPLAGVPHRLGSAAPAPSPRRAPHAGRVAPGVAAGGTTQTSACAPHGLARPLVDPGASHREPRSRVGGRV